MKMAWIKLTAGYWHHPRIRRLGWPANALFVAILCEAKLQGRNGGHLSAVYWEEEHWADILRHQAPGVVGVAMRELVAKGMVTLDNEGVTIPNWSDYQTDPTAARRMREYREKKDVTVTPVTLRETRLEETRGEKKKIPAVSPGFDAFWAAYPRKVGKAAARKAYDKARKSADWPGLDSALAAIKRAKRTEQWRKDGGQFVPLPTTWLNQGRWDDEDVGRGVDVSGRPHVGRKRVACSRCGVDCAEGYTLRQGAPVCDRCDEEG